MPSTARNAAPPAQHERMRLALADFDAVYEGARHLSEATEGQISPGQSTLYPALHQMEAQGFVTARWKDGEGRKRKYYAVTPDGRRELARRKEEWQRFQKTLNAVFGMG